MNNTSKQKSRKGFYCHLCKEETETAFRCSICDMDCALNTKMYEDYESLCQCGKKLTMQINAPKDLSANTVTISKNNYSFLCCFCAKQTPIKILCPICGFCYKVDTGRLVRYHENIIACNDCFCENCSLITIHLPDNKNSSYKRLREEGEEKGEDMMGNLGLPQRRGLLGNLGLPRGGGYGGT